MQAPEVAEFPDSGKLGVFVGGPPGRAAEGSPRRFVRNGDAVDYWEGDS